MVLVPIAATVLHSEFGGGTSITATITAAEGNMLVVAGASKGSATVVTRGTEVYTTDFQFQFLAQYHTAICSATNVQGGAIDLTISESGNVSKTYFVLEIANVPAGNVIDASNVGGNFSASGPGPAVSKTLTNISNDAIFIAVVMSGSTIDPATFTQTASGWSSTFAGTDMTYTTRAIPSSVAAAVAYKIVTATGQSEFAQWTVDNDLWTTTALCYHGFGANQPMRGMG